MYPGHHPPFPGAPMPGMMGMAAPVPHDMMHPGMMPPGPGQHHEVPPARGPPLMWPKTPWTQDPQGNLVLFGIPVQHNKLVRVRTGPVIGKVDHASAIVLVEVNVDANVTVHLVPEPNQPHAVPAASSQPVPANQPRPFVIQGLHPGTRYLVALGGVHTEDAMERVGRVITFLPHQPMMRVAVVSCDRPERYQVGETNMWEQLARKVINNEVDLILHIGDQVYSGKEFEDACAILRQSHDHWEHIDGTLHRRLEELAIDKLRDVYRFTWNLYYTQKVLSFCPNLMIWSDNDIYNDFTLAKLHGRPLPPKMIRFATRVYREYQRQLWDPMHEKSFNLATDEFHFHKFGSIGIIMMDMRGNRVDIHGNQMSDAPIVSHSQWAMVDSVLSDPDIRNLLVCAEMPLITDHPVDAMQKASDNRFAFLRDHWSCSPMEQAALLDRLFAWRVHGGRDVVFVGGDIHVGASTMIVDQMAPPPFQIPLMCVTTSPMSNWVCAFHSKKDGLINNRFTYHHEPIAHNRRNFALFDLSASGAPINWHFLVSEPTKGKAEQGNSVAI